ncbi:hypothetical protein E1A91_D04G003600v1 [Gossypium mustelinum]|uniref:protein-serine/threonine phosphatase n=1 Tax=Gossypium mustelinum TaxID=34275 RepID=A0A5D2V8C1_GOSMU|nr:hypothetical protein E1A91_D04G003600v1 [Gossypium mustelinum]
MKRDKIPKLQSRSTKYPPRMTSDPGEVSRLTVIRTKDARRRRLEIGRLKYTFETMMNITITENSNNGSKDKDDLLHGSKPSNGLTEISLSLSSPSSNQSTSAENGIVLAGFGEKNCMKNDDASTSTCTSHGLLSVIGRRCEMEDAVKVELGFMAKGGEKFDFYGVYDGHGGSRVAEECKERLHKLLVEEIVDEGSGSGIDWGRTMERCFEKMDEEVNKGRMAEEMVGSTAVVAVVGDGKVVVANCGDSRAVLSRGGVAMPLSFDHKPDRPDELERVEAAGGRVINWNGYRVLGVLATSRSIGDQYLKPFVICKPEVTVREVTNGDEFLILASDGLWDVVSNEVACRVVRRCLNGQIRSKTADVLNQNRASEAAAVLVELAMSRGSKDNISVIVVELGKT